MPPWLCLFRTLFYRFGATQFKIPSCYWLTHLFMIFLQNHRNAQKPRRLELWADTFTKKSGFCKGKELPQGGSIISRASPSRSNSSGSVITAKTHVLTCLIVRSGYLYGVGEELYCVSMWKSKKIVTTSYAAFTTRKQEVYNFHLCLWSSLPISL